MKLNEKSLAGASAIVTGVIYVFCAFAIAVFPELSKLIAGSWFHGINIESVWTGMPRGNFVLGFVTSVLGTWITGWLFAFIYNRLVK